MAKITLVVLQFDVETFDGVLTEYNEWQTRRASTLGSVSFPYKAEKIRLISKEKCASQDEKSSFNIYHYTLSYPTSHVLFLFAEQLGVAKAVALGKRFSGEGVASV